MIYKIGVVILTITIQELHLYSNFNELATDILSLAKEILPDRLLFLSAFTEEEQVVLQLSEENEDIAIKEGMSLNLQDTVCCRIDFHSGMPLIFEDISKEPCLNDLRERLTDVNINSYLGIPIVLRNGRIFGTLCAVHQDAKTFNEKSIKMVERIAKMFSYYLELESVAYRDHLTGLYNRRFLDKMFRENASFAGSILFLDLDGFKKVNDVYGHEEGDDVLKEVGDRILSIIDAKKLPATAVRLGGDEFILHISKHLTNEELADLADYILLQLSAWNDRLQDVNLSVSVGIVPYEASGSNLDSLLKKADDALYEAKNSGKNTYCFW